MNKLEDEVSQLLIIEAMKRGTNLLRNNCGVLVDKTGRPVRFGLGNISPKLNEVFKSSDYIGITPVLITQEMVGKKLGVFTAIEMKREDWKFNPNDEREAAQLKFVDWVRNRFGLAGFANSVDTLVEIIGK